MATTTSPALCGACQNPATQTCQGCDNMRYCSSACQQRDKPLHEILCSSFKNFQQRPGEDYRRAIHFPVDGAPQFIWLPYEPGECGLQPRNIKKDWLGDSWIGLMGFDSHRELRRQFDNTIQIYHCDNFFGDGSPPNQALGSVLGAQCAARWRGPFVAHGLRGRQEVAFMGAITPLDLDTTALGPIIAFFKWSFEYGGSMYGYGLEAVVGDGFDP